jgi:hypothetical protein
MITLRFNFKCRIKARHEWITKTLIQKLFILFRWKRENIFFNWLAPGRIISDIKHTFKLNTKFSELRWFNCQSEGRTRAYSSHSNFHRWAMACVLNCIIYSNSHTGFKVLWVEILFLKVDDHHHIYYFLCSLAIVLVMER